MATAPIVTRQDKAIGIAQRHECTPLDDYPGYYSVRDTLTGSGRFHIATLLECDCADFTYRHTPLQARGSGQGHGDGPPGLCSRLGPCSASYVPHVRRRARVHALPRGRAWPGRRRALRGG